MSEWIQFQGNLRFDSFGKMLFSNVIRIRSTYFSTVGWRWEMKIPSSFIANLSITRHEFENIVLILTSHWTLSRSLARFPHSEIQHSLGNTDLRIHSIRNWTKDTGPISHGTSRSSWNTCGLWVVLNACSFPNWKSTMWRTGSSSLLHIISCRRVKPIK